MGSAFIVRYYWETRKGEVLVSGEGLSSRSLCFSNLCLHATLTHYLPSAILQLSQSRSFQVPTASFQTLTSYSLKPLLGLTLCPLLKSRLSMVSLHCCFVFHYGSPSTDILFTHEISFYGDPLWPSRVTMGLSEMSRQSCRIDAKWMSMYLGKKRIGRTTETDIHSSKTESVGNYWSCSVCSFTSFIWLELQFNPTMLCFINIQEGDDGYVLVGAYVTGRNFKNWVLYCSYTHYWSFFLINPPPPQKKKKKKK